MPDEQLVELIDATGKALNLAGVVIEKDYYVTQLIHALSQIENDYFRLVFCGGTCLAKAHKIVGRMSEDIDFKIHLKATETGLSKTGFLKELKKFRSSVKATLMLTELSGNEPVVRNEGKYSRIEMNYPSVFPGNNKLRPHILLEFTVSDIQLPTLSLPIKTLIEETLKDVSLFPLTSIQCVSVNETAIEKWVGLTRRIVGIERNYYPDDDTLVRHLYDLNSIQQANKITADFFTLSNAVINKDANQFGNQHPEYLANPGDEIMQSLDILKSNPVWKERYSKFAEAMVFDTANILEYENALAMFQRLSEGVNGIRD
jgi:predicted nucleotidyltransferase component of viral defense system